MFDTADDDRFDAALREFAQDYNTPPATPRDAMWERIQAARTMPPQATPVLPLPSRPARQFSPWWLSFRMAAVLAAGIGLGLAVSRITFQPAPSGRVTTAATGGRADRAVTYAATEHLIRVETLLTAFRQGDHAAELTAQARDLLVTTRLLLDSRLPTDPKMHALLEDLELILAQITRLPDSGGQDAGFVADGLEHNHVLPRLRAVVPSGSPFRTQGAL